MGNVNCLSLAQQKEENNEEKKAEVDRPPPKQPASSNFARHGSDLRLSLRRSFSKAKEFLKGSKQPQPFYSHAPPQNFDENNAPKSELRHRGYRQRELQGAEAQQPPNMDEVIYIPDDDDPPAKRERRRSSTSSEIEYISGPLARRHRSTREDFSPAPLVRHPLNGNPSGYGHAGPSPAVQIDEFMDDYDFDWNQFVNDPNGGPANNSGGLNAGADPSIMFGIDQRYLGIPELPADPVTRRNECIDEVITIFPDICRDYVCELYDDSAGQISEQLIARILDSIEKGTEYPKARDKLKSLKRKREMNPEHEEEQNYGSIDRKFVGYDYAAITRMILQGEFSDTPMTFIDATLAQTNRLLFPAYRILEEAERTWNPVIPPYNRIKSRRKLNRFYGPEEAEKALLSEATTPPLMEALRELQTARRVRRRAEEKREAERQTELDEEENIRKAEAEGTMLDCGCCYDMFPLNRMVHCENDAMHWFCRHCAKQTAETEVGNQKYEINCMSMDGCEATFSRSQKTIFLDAKTLIALDRNEQEAMLRLAGIENLESCPFCPFAAEYPPIEENKEFRCQAEDCEKVSCRLCRLDSHIPKTCEESAKDTGLSIRRQIEEAMSAALIRKCNKCGTPFVKDEGCNKMTCTRAGCRNVQCYVCSKSCSYDHFNDRSRGGKAGNCPLFESVEQRHEQEVSKAEKDALDRVRAEHPEYSEDDLKIKVSEKVRQDEEKRKAADPRNLARAGVVAVGFGLGHALVAARGRVPMADPIPGNNWANAGDLAVQQIREMHFDEDNMLAEAELMLGILPDPEMQEGVGLLGNIPYNIGDFHAAQVMPLNQAQQLQQQRRLPQEQSMRRGGHLDAQQPVQPHVFNPYPIHQQLDPRQNAPRIRLQHLGVAQVEMRPAEVYIQGHAVGRAAQFQEVDDRREHVLLQRQQLRQVQQLRNLDEVAQEQQINGDLVARARRANEDFTYASQHNHQQFHMERRQVLQPPPIPLAAIPQPLLPPLPRREP